jgi:murein DD-endopeptidase MepM/ murein hydrolase activator NlpD
VKNKIHIYLFLGLSVAFSITGHTQTKPTNKQENKSISTAKIHSKTIKPESKTPQTIVKTKTNDKKTSTPSKPVAITTTSKKIVVTEKSTTKNPTHAAKPLKDNKHDITPLKDNKHDATPSKSGHKNHATVSELATRKHTVIASKTIESVLVKPSNSKKPQRNYLSKLDDAESDQLTHTSNDKILHSVLLEEHTQTTKINTAHVSIETSLFLDGLEADLSKELILQLTDIFAWDIDFATNLRPGDQFTVVYERKIIDGKETDSDSIIAAEFINQGISHTAVRYINEADVASYYTPDGQSMQRAFLSTPVDFAKISSPFDMHRMHPILNRIRAHKGIDYAARIGTPIKTTGDGIVSFSGSKSAYGQVVIIQHNDHYETLYAHMSDFKKGLAVGNHVKQGDVIGYVGQSGLATGPHLHYEFHVDGLYRDPETVKIPHSMPISNALLADFNIQTQPFFAQLNQVKAKSLMAKSHTTMTPSITLPPQLFRYD